MPQHSNLVLLEDLVFCSVIFNVLEAENEYLSWKGLFLCLVSLPW